MRPRTSIVVAARGAAFEVEVRDDAGATRHLVAVDAPALTRFGLAAAPEKMIEATFRFLLDREPKEAILSRFDLAIVSRYFPDYEHELPKYLAPSD